jgi:putative flippase GtrA
MSARWLTRFVRFIGVGGIATGIQYCVLWGLKEFSGTNTVVGSGIGFCLSALANYAMNYHYTFGTNVGHGTALPRFVVVSAGGLALNSLLLAALLRATPWHYMLCQLIATAVVLLWNFLGSLLWSFRELKLET